MAFNSGNYLKAALIGLLAGVAVIAVITLKFVIMEVLFKGTTMPLGDIRSVLNILSYVVTMALPLLAGVLLVVLLRKSSQLSEILLASAVAGVIIGVLDFIGSFLLYDILYYILNPRYAFVLQDVLFSVLYDFLYIVDLTGLTMLGAFLASLILKPGAGAVQATT